MKILECKNCGNSEEGFDIIRCKKCKKIIGCYKTGFWGDKGCAEYDAKTDKCSNCGNETVFGFQWWERYATIGKN